MSELKPCPFCGSEGECLGEWIICSNSSCPLSHPFAAMYLEQWNRRAVPEGMVLVPRDELEQAKTFIVHTKYSASGWDECIAILNKWLAAIPKP